MKNIKYLTAGAGSGKTYFLTNTFAEHVAKGECTCSEVILTTFSEKAAADIKRNARIRFLESKDSNVRAQAAEVDAANIGTVHAMAYRYILKYWYLLGISAHCEVMTDDNKATYIALTLGDIATPDDIDLFRKYVEAIDLKQSQSSKLDYDFWRDAVSDIIDKADSMGVDDLNESLNESLKLFRSVFGSTSSKKPWYELSEKCIDRIFSIAKEWREKFEKYKLDNSIIEYNDMEKYFLQLLDMSDVQEEIRDSIKYVFVDEFQDSNPKQLMIFDKLSELVEKSYWVGDSKQAIYGFRACDTDLVEALTKRIKDAEKEGIPGFETGTLKVSRRSLEPLVTFANQTFTKVFSELDENDVKLDPTHRLETLPHSVPYIQHWDTLTDEDTRPNKTQCIDAMATELKKILDGKGQISKVYDKDNTKLLRDIKPSDIAILCRTNTDTAAIAAALKKYGLPVVIDSRADADKMEIRLVLLMLNYILTESPLLTAELSKLMCGLTLSDILGKEYSDLEKLTAFLQEYKTTLANKGIASIVSGLIIRMDLLDHCAKWGNASDRKDNLMALIKNAKDYETNCLTLGTSATIEGFIKQIENGEIKVEGYAVDGINVVTYHRSKGLQWPVVLMFSLHNDQLKEGRIAKSFVFDVNAVRKAAPTAKDLYPGYYITYVPKQTNMYQVMIKGTEFLNVNNRPGYSPTDPGAFSDFYEASIKEARRLLYVGVTRARDIFIEVGQANKDMTWLSECLRGVHKNGPKWKAITAIEWIDGNTYPIWGQDFPEFTYRQLKADAVPLIVPLPEYDCLPKIAPDETEEAKRISPSTLEDEALVKRASANCINDNGNPFGQIIVKADPKAKDDEIGTCIHNIFAAYNPSADKEDMIRMAGACIERHRLGKALTNPGAIIDSIDILYSQLESRYGKAVKIEHEVPFRGFSAGKMMVGSIDLVWYTEYSESSKNCVLVDFKNLPGASASVLAPNDDRFLGHYVPQQNAYKEALEAGGVNVKDCIIYLSMQGKVVSLQW